MLNSEFNEFASKPDVELLPKDRADSILELAQSFYNTVNNGVYRCGFATTQEAYDKAFGELFAELDHLNEHLSTRRFMAGSELTLADVRLFPTLARFDAVYVQHFKCNKRQIKEYEHLYGFVRDMYQQPGIGETVDIGHIKRHYCTSHPTINKYGIIPNGYVAGEECFFSPWRWAMCAVTLGQRNRLRSSAPTSHSVPIEAIHAAFPPSALMNAGDRQRRRTRRAWQRHRGPGFSRFISRSSTERKNSCGRHLTRHSYFAHFDR